MNKEENIFKLYEDLPKDGARGDAIAFVAKTCKVKKANVKANWFLYREFPSYITDRQKDEIITYLQKAVNLNNQSVS